MRTERGMGVAGAATALDPVPHWLAVGSVGVALILLVTALSFPDGLLWSVGSCAALLLAAAAQSRRSAYGVLSPFAVIMVGQVLYVLPVALALWNGSVLTDRRLVSPEAMGRAILLANAALVCFAVGYLLRLAAIAAYSPPRGVAAPWRRTAVVMVALPMMVLGLAAMMLLVLQLGGPGQLTSVTYGERYLMLQGKGYLYVGLQVATVGVVLLHLASIESRRMALGVAVVIVTGAILAVWMFMFGSRSSLVQFVIAIVAVHHIRVRRLRLAVLVPLGGMLVVLMVVFGLARGLLGRANPVSLLAAAPSWNYSLANSEFGAAVTALADIMERVPTSTPHVLGITYPQSFAVLVPQVLWPDRPLAAGEWYAATFYPSVWRAGGAFAFSPVAEAYLNFGYAGVLLLSCLFGSLVGEGELRLARVRALSPWGIAAYALLVPWMLLLSRLDSATLLKSVGLFTMGPLLVARIGAAVTTIASLPRIARRT